MDPLNAIAYQNLGHVLGFAGRHEEAMEALHRAYELAPQAAGTCSMLAHSLLELDRSDEALVQAAREPFEVFRLYGLSEVLWTMGRKEESDRNLEELVERWATAAASQIAELYASRGDVDTAFEWVDRAIETRDAGIMEARGNPRFASLHSDPRWAALQKRLNYED